MEMMDLIDRELLKSDWSIMIYRTHKGDFYCADAERKNDG